MWTCPVCHEPNRNSERFCITVSCSGESPDARLHHTGIVYARKRRGRKMLFVVGGPTLKEAAGYLIPQPGYVYFHVSHAGDTVGIVADRGV